MSVKQYKNTSLIFRRTRSIVSNVNGRHEKKSMLIAALLLMTGMATHAQNIRMDTIGCSLNESDTAYLSRMIKFEAGFYNKAVKTHNNDTAAVNITFYGNNRAYIRAVKQNKLNASVNGVYSAKANKIFVYQNGFYVHGLLGATSNKLLSDNYPNAPRWLTEGFASVMSCLIETGDKKINYTPLFDYNMQLKKLTWSDGGIDFDYLFMDNNPDWNNTEGASATLPALSYGVIYFLIIQNKDYLTPIISSLKEGHSATEAIVNAFGSFDDFKNQFIVYYRYSARSKFQ